MYDPMTVDSQPSVSWGGKRQEYSYEAPERVFMEGYPPHGTGILIREFMWVPHPMKR